MTKFPLIPLRLCLFILLGPLATGAVTDFAETRAKAENGDANAQVKLGDKYNSGEGVTKDSTEAVKWYRKAAEQGLAEAQYDLGGKYDRGDGVAKDLGEALKWYRKAADQGHSTAEYNLGVMYYRAFGMPQDLPEAVKWYRKAAEQGNADAQLGLAAFYYAGAGVEKDETESLAWFDVSALAGIDSAIKNRDILERSLGPEKSQIARQRSAEILKKIRKEDITLPPFAQEYYWQDFAVTKEAPFSDNRHYRLKGVRKNGDVELIDCAVAEVATRTIVVKSKPEELKDGERPPTIVVVASDSEKQSANLRELRVK